MKATLGVWVLACGLCLGFSAAGAETYAYRTLAGWPGSAASVDGINFVARFNNPYGLAVDGTGTIYVADTYNCTVRKVVASGTNWVVSTLAGLANACSWADGTNNVARFSLPYGVAVDSAGNLYVADYSNHVIRKIRPVGTNWVVSTLAGSSLSGGNVDGTNSNARFENPFGIAVDRAGTLYVTDFSYNTIRKVAPVGTNWVVTTLAGGFTALDSGSTDGTNRAARFFGPSGLAVDGATNLYVADSGNSTIRNVRPQGTNWVVTTLAGLALNSGSADGTNSTARFGAPAGVAVDGATNLYVADAGGSTIRKIVPVGTNWVTSTIGGLANNSGIADGTNTLARFSFPAGVAVDGTGVLYIADRGNSTVRLGVPSLSTPPTLCVASTPTQLVLSWPLTAYTFALQTSGSVSSNAVWTPITSGMVIAGTSFYWTNSFGRLPAYYRLKK